MDTLLIKSSSAKRPKLEQLAKENVRDISEGLRNATLSTALSFSSALLEKKQEILTERTEIASNDSSSKSVPADPILAQLENSPPVTCLRPLLQARSIVAISGFQKSNKVYCIPDLGTELQVEH